MYHFCGCLRRACEVKNVGQLLFLKARSKINYEQFRGLRSFVTRTFTRNPLIDPKVSKNNLNLCQTRQYSTPSRLFYQRSFGYGKNQYAQQKQQNVRFFQSFRWQPYRQFSNKSQKRDNRTVLLYLLTAAVTTGGLSYAAVPLYRIYCQASGYGGTTKLADAGNKIAEMSRVEDRAITIRFEANTGKQLQWRFKPQQTEVQLTPGETALAFYTAENLTERPIIGIATYNVLPFDAGQYFNKIQCFCFEEQQLNPNEEVDMPVFFYIDPDFNEDPKMEKVREIVLSYTFFESTDFGDAVPTPHVKRLPQNN